MARCTICGAETSLYLDGAPICIPCDDKRLQQESEKKVRAEMTVKEYAIKKSA